MSRRPPPDFLVIGHVTLDMAGDAAVPGGAAFYASLAAARLGRSVALLTRGAPPAALEVLSPSVRIVNLPSETTTTFRNVYHADHRQQWLLARTGGISPGDVPPSWQRCPVVLLAPVAAELPLSMAQSFPGALIGLNPQGWLRRWDAFGRVRPRPWPGSQPPRAALIVLSHLDLPGGDLPQSWLSGNTLLVVTYGAEGAIIYHGGQRWRIPPFAARAVDPTGAGDIFTAAYLVRYSETGERESSGLFAACAASFGVENSGADCVPFRASIERRLDAHKHLRVTAWEIPK